jgi:hypothetical protein
VTGGGAGFRASADFWCMGHSGCDDIRMREWEQDARDTYWRAAAFIDGGGVVVCWGRRRRLVCPKPSHVCDLTSRSSVRIKGRAKYKKDEPLGNANMRIGYGRGMEAN